MNIAMLGSGFIGRFYADSLQGYRSKDKIVTIYSRRDESAKKFARDYKVGFSTTKMEEAINRPEVEVVCISLPNNLHEEAVMLCCKHKKAVITTKPARRGGESRHLQWISGRSGLYTEIS
jgi:predicted dehydrogenase